MSFAELIHQIRRVRVTVQRVVVHGVVDGAVRHGLHTCILCICHDSILAVPDSIASRIKGQEGELVGDGGWESMQPREDATFTSE